MKSVAKLTAVLCCLALLSACGGGDAVTSTSQQTGAGGGGAGSGGGGGGNSNPAFDETRWQSIGALGDGTFTSANVATITSNFTYFGQQLFSNRNMVEIIPTTGSATYNGWLGLNTSDNAATETPSDKLYYGRIQLNTNFATKAVDGNVGDFSIVSPPVAVDQFGFPRPQAVSGSASFSGTITDTVMGVGTSEGFYGDLSGNLDGATLTGPIEGIYYTDTTTGQRFIYGGGSLTLGSDDTTDADFLAAD